MSSRFLRRLVAIPLLGVVALGLTVLLHGVNQQLEEAQARSPLGALNDEITDLALQVREQTNQDSLWSRRDIVVVDIDDASVRELGRVQSWPRAYDAQVARHINAGDPAAVGFDILYPEPDSFSSYYTQLLRRAGYQRPHRILAALNTDDQLAGALAASGRSYLALYDGAGRPGGAADSVDLAATLSHASVSSPAARRIPALTHPVLPIPPLRRAAAGVAPIPLPTAADGVVRYYPVARRLTPDTAATDPVRLIPTFSVLLAADVLDVPVSALDLREGTLRLGSKRTLPITRDGRLRINWLGQNERIQRIPYYKVLRKSVPAAYFEGKTVLIGGSATGLEDQKATPMPGNEPGVVVHAEALLNILNRAYLPEWTLGALWPWLLGLSLPFLGLVVSVPPLAASLVMLGVGSIEFFGYVLYFFPTYGLVLPVGTILLFTLFAFIGGVVFKYVTEEWEKRQLRDAFTNYVSTSIVEQVTEQPDALELGGEKRTLTVLFSDIRNFTTYSEDLDPREVVGFLNRYFDHMTAAVFEHDGTVDKFMGDGMMAIFGAPLEYDDHARRACAAGLSMARALDELNRKVNLDDASMARKEPISIGVGINTGEMVAGNIGSSQRFEYTVVGDAVNLAARLEPLNRLFDTRILVSSSTYEAATPAPWSFRRLGAIRVKGRADPVTLYELMVPSRYPDPEALASAFAEGLDHYHQRSFDAALDCFRDCLDLHPADGPAAHYAELCTNCRQAPERYAPVLDVRGSSGS